VDANQAWPLPDALKFVEACQDLDLHWVEEPVHWDNDIVDLAVLREQTDIPICAGQSEITVAGVARLIDAGAIDICNLHPGYVGGITPWLTSAELARQNGLKVANTGEPQLSASLMLACEHGMSVEIYHPDRDPIFPQYCPAFNGRKNGRIEETKQMGWGLIPTPAFENN
jgi:D-galactarolactone cycloisomerase